MVLGSLLLGHVPVRRAGGAQGPAGLPAVLVPRCRLKRIVRSLRTHEGEEGLAVGGHISDPCQRVVADERSAVIIRAVLKRPVRQSTNVLNVEEGTVVAAASVSEPCIEARLRLPRTDVEVLAEHAHLVASLLTEMLR